jgi:hypothetical protein
MQLALHRVTVKPYTPLCAAPLCLAHSGGMDEPDLAIFFLNHLSYDKMSTVNLIELGDTHLLVLDTLS